MFAISGKIVSSMKEKFTGFRLQVTVSISLLLFFLFALPCTLSTTYAITDPLSAPNNKFGIHLITPSPDESSPAASLVNTNGDWGYITVLMTQKDKVQNKWQEFFNDLRRRHLIPIIRIATEPEGKNWKRPDPDDANSWADFLNSLIWPTKNRYVVVYNEPNQSHEWGGMVDAGSYARILDKMRAALKSRSEDFFVLNAGLDASAPQSLPNYEDEVSFLRKMEAEVPGILNELDGWASHSYPNPEFSGSPEGVGRGSIRTWSWELQQLRNLGVSKMLPVFITETGWKHAEGLNYNPGFPDSNTLSTYYKKAFEEAWNNPEVIAITPFLLNYQEVPFDHFSFKKIANGAQEKIISALVQTQGTDYYPFYESLQKLTKTFGKPAQDIQSKLIKGEVYSSIVAGQSYSISLTFKNTGQSIWNDGNKVKLVPLQSGPELGIDEAKLPDNIKVEPGSEYTFSISLKAPQRGVYKVRLNLFSDNVQFSSEPVEFTTEVKEPVILQILSKLRWKNSSMGDYILRVNGVVGESSQSIELDQSGKSKEIEAKYLLPDYSFDFTLEKPYYHPVTIHKSLTQGLNVLDFGTLQPTLLQAILNPREFWKLLPWSK